MSLQLHGRGSGGLRPNPVQSANWRSRLRSRRWNVSPLANPEGRPLRPLQGVLFFGTLAVITFVVLVLGYGSGFWGS